MMPTTIAAAMSRTKNRPNQAVQHLNNVNENQAEYRIPPVEGPCVD